MSKPFTFKQFTINQDHTPMKVGTDGVLLGAWCSCNEAISALDIGTGTGLIALMLAQRNAQLNVTAIEPNALAFAEAVQNFKNSPWQNRLNPKSCALEDFKPDEKYDLIVANPPFFANSLKAPDADRTMARHISQFDPKALVNSASLLSANGRIAGIYPVDTFAAFDSLASDAGLIPNRICSVRPNPDKPAHRILFEYTFHESDTTPIEELIIEDGERHSYTQKYKELTADFYLNF